MSAALLPEKLPLRSYAGLETTPPSTYMENYEFGIKVEIRHESRSHPYRELWTHRDYPERSWTSYGALRQFIHDQEESKE